MSSNSIILIGCCVYFVHILRTHFRAEFKNAWRKTLLESLVKFINSKRVKILSKCPIPMCSLLFNSDVFSVIQFRCVLCYSIPMCSLLSNCKQKRMHLFCKTCNFFFIFPIRIWMPCRTRVVEMWLHQSLLKSLKQFVFSIQKF